MPYTRNTIHFIKHVLQRPDMYIGAVKATELDHWVIPDLCSGSDPVVCKKSIQFIPGLYKIFDEILVNAADNSRRDSLQTRIEVSVRENTIQVFNDGRGRELAHFPSVNNE